MPLGADEIRDFYERCYQPSPNSESGQRWRELGARVKAQHVVRLLEQARASPPASVLEVGCGDGIVLAELARRGIGQVRDGIDISSSAISAAVTRPEVAHARVFDGDHIHAADAAYDLVLLTHVLEHVPSPLKLLAEATRVSQSIIVEVPLERNLSAKRPTARRLSERSGHIQRFARRDIRSMIETAGFVPAAELIDPLPNTLHLFDADGLAKARGYAKASLRRAIGSVPWLAERLFTLHYAVFAVPARP